MTQPGTPPGDLGSQAYEGLEGPFAPPSHAWNPKSTPMTTSAG